MCAKSVVHTLTFPWAPREELQRTRRQLRETRQSLNGLAANMAKTVRDHELELKHMLKLIIAVSETAIVLGKNVAAAAASRKRKALPF